MGKNKRHQIDYYDAIHSQSLSVDSIEEIDTLNWLTEATQLSIIEDFEYQPNAFKLFDSEKYVNVHGKTRSLFRDHQYTPDFIITLNPNTNLKLSEEFKIDQSELSNSSVSVFIDTKGTFNKTERAFNLNQKWVWQRFKIYIYKLVPKNFFALFGCPKKSFTTARKKQPRKLFQGCKTLKEMFGL